MNPYAKHFAAQLCFPPGSSGNRSQAGPDPPGPPDHQDFDEISEAVVAPTYEAIFSRDSDGVLTREWKRKQ